MRLSPPGHQALDRFTDKEKVEHVLEDSYGYTESQIYQKYFLVQVMKNILFQFARVQKSGHLCGSGCIDVCRVSKYVPTQEEMLLRQGEAAEILSSYCYVLLYEGQ